MGTYVKKTCGYCGKAIESWHKDAFSKVTKIGNPFMECPHCGHINIDKYTKEYTMLTRYDYFKMHVPTIWGSIGISLILSTIIMLVFKIETDVIFISIFVIIFVISLFFFVNKDNKEIESEINLSKERLKDENYKKMIDSIIANQKKKEHWYDVK